MASIPQPSIRVIDDTRVIIEPITRRSFSIWVNGKEPYSIAEIGKLWFVHHYQQGRERVVGIKERQFDALQLAVAHSKRQGDAE